MLFVVAGGTWVIYSLPSMLDFDAICRGRTSFVSFYLSFFHAPFLVDLSGICRVSSYLWRYTLNASELLAESYFV